MEHNWTEIAQGIGSIASAIISVVGFLFIYRQIKQANDNLKQSNHTAIYSINTELYKFFAENSDLRPYFHDGKNLTENDKNKILSVSELLADFFEFILVEKNSLAPEIRQPWLNYMNKIFANSPGFRYFMHENKDQYCEELLSVFAAVSPLIPEITTICRELETEKDFYEVDNIYQECFGNSSVPTATQLSWWKKQPNGIIALEEEKQLIGGISFWNITSEAYKKLLSGQIREKEIRAEDLATKNSGYIYISETAIKKDFRNKKYSFHLLKKVILEIENRFKSKGNLVILALGYSVEGEILLNKIGFKKMLDATQTKDKQPLYLLSIDSQEELLKIKKAIL